MPGFERLELHMVAADRVHGDDTTVPVLAHGRTDTGRIWAYVRDAIRLPEKQRRLRSFISWEIAPGCTRKRIFWQAFAVASKLTPKFSRVQTMTAAGLSGTPSTVNARLERKKTPQTVCHRTGPAFVVHAIHALGDADRFRRLPVTGELRIIMQHKDQVFGRAGTDARRFEMPGEDVAFVDPIIRQEVIRRFGTRSVPAGKGYALYHRSSDLSQQFTAPLCQAFVGKAEARTFSINLPSLTIVYCTALGSVLTKEQEAIHAVQMISALANRMLSKGSPDGYKDHLLIINKS